MATIDRYQKMFAQLERKGEKAFVPFLMLGDPSPADSVALVEAVIAGGADALELGIGFSDPVADGPVVAEAHLRALSHPPVLDRALQQLAQIRARHPEIPIGILAYANLALGEGAEDFCCRLGQAGVDSLLVADCPLREKTQLLTACQAAGLAPIFIAPPNLDQTARDELLELEQGYIYLVSRPGVTGVDLPTRSGSVDVTKIARDLRSRGSIPVLQGFGIHHPDQIRQAIAGGVDGVICGSALLNTMTEYLSGTCGERADCGSEGFQRDLAVRALQAQVERLKAATRLPFAGEIAKENHV